MHICTVHDYLGLGFVAFRPLMQALIIDWNMGNLASASRLI